ncbi:MAG: hypothetical protein IPL59_22210 [Candidatus Competibacteraceae bacterium]|jgi:hypothetical protein|uniref:hypothetical protein n=1 Tax=Candidatus Contendibacter odensensis TaxID=1400860 RepID=UPI0004BBDD28|nr:hypothetical protein [Candidatus Contendobacter odensis]MBK8537575.1 hypothetical protein [Candidatus Competibacteraceae bacterium]MBK8751433.1 hypothetical protein [Candidatus Competibacteraceae bacterium]
MIASLEKARITDNPPSGRYIGLGRLACHDRQARCQPFAKNQNGSAEQSCRM